jgi:hypothetical protein
MDDRASETTANTDQLFHKEKKQKKTEGNRSIGNRTVAKGSTHISNVNSLHHNLLDSKSIGKRQEQGSQQRRAAAIKNAEIDEFIQNLIMEGIVDEKFFAWTAKCIHTLGLVKVNSIVVNARNGKNPQRLLSFKLQGALQVHFKRQFDIEV